MPHKYFVLDGVATYLHHTGATTLPETPPDLSRGEVLLCLHGTGGHGGDFEGLLPALSAAHSPLAFDQPGHGRSGGLDSLGSIERMRDFTRALASKLGLRPQVLVGHSLGAAVALDYALEAFEASETSEASEALEAKGHSGDVRGLVIVSGGAGFSCSPEFLENARLITEGKRRRSFDAKAFAPGAPPETMRRAFMAGMKTDPRATYGDLMACVDWRRGEELGRIALPTLILHGDAERKEVVEQADRLHGLLPQARKVVVPGAGQMILYEQPAAVADEIVKFLEELR